MLIDYEDFNKWRIDGKPIEDVLNYLTDDERELLLSGVCGICFDKIYDLN
jgi:hypothetical protein